MGFPVPVNLQLPYPISMVKVAHRELKFSAITFAEKLLWELRKEQLICSAVYKCSLNTQC